MTDWQTVDAFEAVRDNTFHGLPTGWQRVYNHPPRGKLVIVATVTGTYGLATWDGYQWHIQEYDRKYIAGDGVEKWIDPNDI